jgi:hypothetical protein
MQPLSRVRSNALAHFAQRDTMQLRPALAPKIAHCVSQFSSLEAMLGISLALMLHGDAKVMLAMYISLDNRAAQLRMLQAGAEAKLNKEQSTLMSALLSIYIKPLMKNRDKFVHWVWGYSDDLPDDLLITNSTDSMSMHMALVGDIDGEHDYSKVFVVKDTYFNQISDQTQIAIELYGMFIGTFWHRNDQGRRAELLQTLSDAPSIRAWLDRQNKDLEKTQTTPQQSPP